MSLRTNSRPARASSMRKSTCAPKYGAGRCRRTVAWISCSSNASACAGGAPAAVSSRVDMARALADLVEKLVDGLADLFEPSGLRDGQVRIGDIPAIRLDLVAQEILPHLRTVHARIALTIAEQHVERIRNLRGEGRDIGIPVPVKRRSEQELGIVVEEHEAHVVHRADGVRALEVAAQDTEESPEPIRPAWFELENQEEFRDFALPDADSAGGCGFRRHPHCPFQLRHHPIERNAT